MKRVPLKKRIAVASAVAILAAAIPQLAQAQSSVTLYGLISTGILYTSNSGGKSVVSMASGPEQLPRMGLKGREELGGGTAAIFTLENGFNSVNGSLGQGGRMFGRWAYVGLTNNTYGTVTVGRQLEEMAQQLYWSESGVIFAAFGTRIGDNDNIFNSNRFNNSIRYASPNIHGLTFAGSYAFSNQADGFSNNNGYSFGANYVSGSLKLGAAFTQFNHPAVASNLNGAVDDGSWGFSNPFVKSLGGAVTAQQRIMGVGASYNFNIVQVAAGYTNVLYNYLDSTGLRLQNAELTVTKQITPTTLLGAGYIFTAGNYSADQQPRYHQVNLGAVYSLSKRTDLWLVGMYMHAAGDAHHAQIYTTTASSTQNQMAVVTGIRTRF
ncbi:porin [Paraburkholderia heleia]|uniref:porin n=1 Tax=Paraburkholderia heleia TaxID=634127 RepID=UPI0031D6EBF2